jgi:hypothetical protein
MKRLIITLLIITFMPVTLNAYTSEDTARSVVNSLKTEPEKWRHDQHRLYYFKDATKFETTAQNSWNNKADCVIWIANEAYGIEIQSPKKVQLPKKVREFIWDTYQLWANDHFAKVFEEIKAPEVVKKLEPIKSDEPEFTSLLTKSKVEREPDDFFSQIPNGVIGVVIAFFIVWILLGISIIIKRKKGDL